jgi:hypothetical protein
MSPVDTVCSSLRTFSHGTLIFVPLILRNILANAVCFRGWWVSWGKIPGVQGTIVIFS